ncbi:MAG: PLP-dependent aminotransferase family protein [Deferribacteraceae bacterium]|jgi:GntR family transcriptional regulator of abcA and norABC|nr:PLP-dependent aminotransferase family protein [Deferribacteraceae bacterium]
MMTKERSAIPLYAMVADELRNEIISGKLPVGMKLPGRRAMLKKFRVSKGTLAVALAQLVQEGHLISYPKSGFVVTNANFSAPDWSQYIKLARHKPGVQDYRHWANNEDGLTELGFSSDFNIMPFIERPFQNSLKELQDRKNIQMYSKYGFEPLREAVAKQLALYGINCGTENILITSSTIQILYPLYESLMTYGSNFIYEKANLINTISNIHSLGLNMIPISMDKHGVSETELEARLIHSSHPILHLDTTDQAPTGIVMSKTRKLKIMELVRRYRFPVVEIDHLREGWHRKPFPPPLKALDTCGHVIYMGSFIRSFPFDFQISWLVADPYLVEHLSNVQVQHGIKVNYLLQLAANDLFRNGIYFELTNAYRSFIRERREKTLALCKKYLAPLAVWDEKNCGFHFWINFQGINIRKAFAKTHYSHYYPGYFFDRSDTSHVLVCPCSIRAEFLESVVKELAAIAEQNSR